MPYDLFVNAHASGEEGWEWFGYYRYLGEAQAELGLLSGKPGSWKRWRLMRTRSAKSALGRLQAEGTLESVHAIHLLRQRYHTLFDAGEFARAAEVYSELLAAEARLKPDDGGRCREGQS
jgi:hypothetical protein